MIIAHSFRVPVLFDSIQEPDKKYLICDGQWREVPKETKYADIKWFRKFDERTPNPAFEHHLEWEVDGSKGKKYLVELKGKQWSCQCHAFSWSGGKRTCKHVETKKAELQAQTDYNNKLTKQSISDEKLKQALKNNWEKKQRIYKSLIPSNPFE